MTRRVVVAIDGPAGAGKSTAARGVAVALGYALVDTGALYRAVALSAIERGISPTDRAAVEALAHSLVREGVLRMEARAGQVPRVLLGEREPGPALRTPEVSMASSAVSAHPGVREALLALQRSFGKEGGVVLEGRDIGTVVFPHAEVKVFLTASPHARAVRRHEELVAKGANVTLEEVLADAMKRDEQDSGRSVAPLKPAEDAVVLDSTALSEQEVTDAIVRMVRAREG